MQLWIRRCLCFHFGFLFLIAQLNDAGQLRGQDPVSNSDKPNALRMPDRIDSKTQEPPTIDWNDHEEFSEVEFAIGENLDTDGVFVIGSADTRLLSGTDSDAVEFADSAEVEEAIANDEDNLALAFELANASFAHSLSVYSWLIKPTLVPYQSADPTKASRDESSKRDRRDESEGKHGTETDLQQPELLAKSSEIDVLGNSTKDDKGLVKTTEEDVGNTDTNKVADGHKKPVARAIRTPFEIDDPSDSKAKSTIVEQHDPDSQVEQDEPRLDAAKKSNDRELQGVDALNASKPRSNRREVQIVEPSANGKTVPPIIKKQTIEPELERRLQKANACLRFYLEHPESTSVRSPWAVMHALIAFGSEYELTNGHSRVNAIGWMCHNGTCRTQRMFSPKGRSFVPNVGGGVQGHEGQFLAILAQSNVPLDYPIQIGASLFKVEDLVRYEMATCKEKSELTFKLIGLSYYLDTNKQWKANDGKIWSIPKLIQEELAQPIIGSACGGTHRLMGFSFSVRQRQLQNQPINGQYARAVKFVREYIAYTLQLQNPDGSFSTDWYEGRANDPNEERKVQTSGHMLEWLMFSMTDEEIKQPKIAKGIEFILSKIYDKREQKWPIGPRGHATRAIALYHERMTDLIPAAEPQKSVSKNPASTAIGNSPAPIIRK